MRYTAALSPKLQLDVNPEAKEISICPCRLCKYYISGILDSLSINTKPSYHSPTSLRIPKDRFGMYFPPPAYVARNDRRGKRDDWR